MSKIIAAKKRIARQYGVDLYGEHRSTRKKKPYLPGMHGDKVVRRVTTYSSQLRAKQILKFYYGLTERQLKNYANKAMSLSGNAIQNLVNLLERRLDVVVFRSGFAPTIFAAKQLVSHGHIEVDGRRVNIVSYSVANNKVLSLRNTARKMDVVINAISSTPTLRKIADFLEVDNASFSSKIAKNIEFAEVPYECEMNFALIIEYYSK